MTLSIGMIVKNESKNLRECLTALQPILLAVESELIIADTGSTDDTVAIAREFTDKVMEVEWQDDFSAARNFTVRAAKGEWFMYLDADEIWRDTVDLVKFFTGDEYKKYNSATHILHDKMADGQVRQITLSRLFKLEEGTKFHGIVHEAIPYKPPQKHLRSYSEHLGHSAATPIEAAAKTARNMRLMQRAFEADPTDTHNLAQLCLATLQNEEPDRLKKYLDAGFAIIADDPAHESFHFFYRHLALFYYRADEWDAAISLVQEYLKKAAQTVAAIDMYHILADSLLKHGETDKAFAAFEKCYALIKKHKNNKLNTEPAAFDVLNALNPAFAPTIRQVIRDLKAPKRGASSNKGGNKGGNKSKPKLSVGMIVKNESKNLRKCLEALQPILTRVHSELIIADTGSTDDTISIAREFTDKVMQIEWQDDFAAARNHTLRAANGEWFMFMDADEFWQDTEDLVAFFNSGEYRNYGSAIHQRTDLLESGRTAHASSMRLAKILPGTKFTSPVHEYLTSQPPVKILSATSHHVGYAYETEEEKDAKYQRNMGLMLAAHQKDPSNMHIVAQICLQTMDLDNEIFEKFIHLGLENLKDQPSSSLFHLFYRRLQQHRYNNKEHESVISIGLEYLQKASLTVTAVDVYAMMAESYKALRRFKDAAIAGENSKLLYAKMKAGLLDMKDAANDILWCVNPEFEEITGTTLALIYSELGEFNKMFELLKKSNPAKDGFMEFYLAAIERAAMYKEAVTLYELIAKQETALYQQLLAKFEEFLQKSPSAALFYNAFANLQTDDFYISLLQLRAADLRNDMLGVYTLLSGFQPLFKPVEGLPFARGEALFLAFKYNALFAEVTAALDIEIIADTVAQMELKTKDFAQSVAEALKQYESPADSAAGEKPLPNKTALWLQSITFAAILSAKENPDADAQLHNELSRHFLAFSNSYMHNTYRAENLTDKNIDKLPGLYRFAYYAGQDISKAANAAPDLAKIFNRLQSVTG